MGILKNFEGDVHDNENVNSLSHIDPLINTNHYSDTSSSSEDEEVHENVVVSTPAPVLTTPLTSNRTPKVKKITSKIPKPILQIKNFGGKKSQGHRHARRHENMCFLLNLAKDLDEDFAEVNINDLVENSVSAFAQLLLSKNKMKIWNEFIDLPEHQQEQIVKMATSKRKPKKQRKRSHDSKATLSCSSDDTIETYIVIEKHTTIDNYQPIDLNHRQQEADSCFRRIDSNIRYALKSMIKRHHLPLECITCFEDDLIPYFKELPDSVYLRDLSNSFDRMLLHAVCQYLNLISKSFTQDGQRYTQVENHHKKFVPPIMLLSEYITLLDGMMKTAL